VIGSKPRKLISRAPAYLQDALGRVRLRIPILYRRCTLGGGNWSSSAILSLSGKRRPDLTSTHLCEGIGREMDELDRLLEVVGIRRQVHALTSAMDIGIMFGICHLRLAVCVKQANGGEYFSWKSSSKPTNR